MTRELPLTRRAVQASPTIFPRLGLRRRCLDSGALTGQPCSWAACQAGIPGPLLPRISETSVSSHPSPAAAGWWRTGSRWVLRHVMVTAWERSHLHFLSDWLPGGGKPELDASAKWSLHRTPLSRTIPSFNLPLCKQNNENCPFQVLALWPAPVFPHRELRLVSLLSVRPCNSSLLSPQDIWALPRRGSAHQPWAM